MLEQILGAAVGGLSGLLGSNKDKTARTQTTSNTDQTQVNSFAPDPRAQQFYNFLGSLGNQVVNTPVPFYPGQTYVGPSSDTQRAWELARGGADLYGQAIPQQQAAAGTALGNFNFLSGAADVANNPYVQGMANSMTSRLNQNFLEGLLPQINQGASSVNALGGSRQGILQAQGLERTQEQLSRGLTDLYGSAYGQGLGAQQAALGSLGGLQAGMMQPGVTQGAAAGLLSGVGQSREGYEQAALQDAMARFYHPYTEPLQRLQLAGSLAQQFMPLGSQTTRTQGTGFGMEVAPNSSYMNPIAGGLLGALGGWGLMGGQQNYAPVSGPTRQVILPPSRSGGGY